MKADCVLCILVSVCLEVKVLMGGKTSSTVKNRYNAKAYDQIPLRVKKGQKEIIQKRAEQLEKSVNGYIVDLIEKDLSDSDT